MKKSFVLIAAALFLLFALPSSAEDKANIALNKPAAASSTYPGYMPESAVDGDMGSIWAGRVGSQSDKTTVWWQIDLEDYYKLNDIIVYFRPDAKYDYERKNFRIVASKTDDFSERTVLKEQGDEDCGSVLEMTDIEDEGLFRYIRLETFPREGEAQASSSAIREFIVHGDSRDVVEISGVNASDGMLRFNLINKVDTAQYLVLVCEYDSENRISWLQKETVACPGGESVHLEFPAELREGARCTIMVWDSVISQQPLAGVTEYSADAAE